MDSEEEEIADAAEAAQLRAQGRKVHAQALGMALLLTGIALGS